jgi:hypothetical protein
MSIWRIDPITVEPHSKLENWRVILVKGNFDDKEDSTHFVGTVRLYGRVSSPIQSFDPKTRRGVSRSGRIYELIGKSGYLEDNAEYVLDNWLRVNGYPEIKDITEQFS